MMALMMLLISDLCSSTPLGSCVPPGISVGAGLHDAVIGFRYEFRPGTVTVAARAATLARQKWCTGGSGGAMG